MMIKMDDSRRICGVIAAYNSKMKAQRNWLVAWRIVVSLLLCVVLSFIFIVFSIRTNEGIKCNFYGNDILLKLDANGTEMLWIIVFIVIAGLIWMIVRTLYQLKRYQTCIRKLEILLCKVAITNDDLEGSLIGEKICEELQSITSVFDKKSTNE